MKIVKLFLIIVALIPATIIHSQDDEAPIIPAITIESIQPQGDNAYVVELSYVYAHLIGGLRVQVVDRQSNVDVYRDDRPNAQNVLNIPSAGLEPNTEYRLTISALDRDNNLYQYSTQGFSGAATVNTVRAESTFRHNPRIITPVIEVRTVDFDDETLSFVLQLEQQNVESIASYAVWLEGERTGLRLTSNDLIFSAPRDQIIVEMDGAGAGAYRAIVEGRAADGTVLARTARAGLAFEPPSISFFRRLQDNPLVIGLIFGVMLVAFGMLYWSIAGGRSNNNVAQAFYTGISTRRRGKLVGDKDDTMHRLPSNKRRKLLQESQKARVSASLIVDEAPDPYRGQTHSIGRVPFTIGREDQNLTFNIKSISRLHVVISSEDGQFFLEDPVSRNGTRLNNRHITGRGRQPLNKGDSIDLAGKVTLRFQ